MKLFAPTPEINCFEDYNKQLLLTCDFLNNRKRKGFYKCKVNQMLETDKTNLIELPEIDFEVATFKNRRCNDMGCITIQDKHYYYLSPKYIKKKVIVKFTATRIYFYDEFNRPLLNCVRLYDNTNAIYVNWG